ncbi:MAG: DUF5011 domain-containing protein [Bacteroidia bacterium]|nr:DUF5011 domain-containing protein [Bacteroidia bacterium]
MKITFTNFKRLAYRASGRLALLLATVLYGSAAFGQTTPYKPNCEPKHYYGCAYNTTTYRYGAIEEVSFASGGKTLYTKAADGCNDRSSTSRTTDHYNEITTTSAFQLSYGGEVTISINGQSYAGGSNNYINVGIWADLNRDGDFEDTDEFFGNHQVNAVINRTHSGTLPTPTQLTFNIPCGAKGTGETMWRIRAAAYYHQPWQRSMSCLNGGFAQGYYGETEDYRFTLANSTTLKAGFHVLDTAFVKVPVDFKNVNQNGYKYHGWDIGDDGSIDYTSVNASHKFTSTGKECVRLYSENCIGRDSIAKCVQIINPTAPPVADFVANANKIELYNTFQLTDLSTNGAIYWDWFLYQDSDSAGTRIDGDTYLELRGGDETVNKNPEIFTAKGIPGFPDVGKWCVGLTASNDIGASVTVIKKNYLEVIKGCDVEMGPGTLTSIPGNVITCTGGSLISKGDGSGNYSANENGLDALVAPCGATSITFTFDKWVVKAGVNLKIYDGQDATGTPLHPNLGFTEKDVPTAPLVAKSGAMYFLWSSGSQTDEGFLGFWTSTVGTQAPPVADFGGADTAYNAVFNTFTNTSKNATGEVFYTWEVDGTVESNSKDLETIFFSNKTTSVCLTVETCAGKSKTCKNVVVSPITSKAELDFDANNRRPKAGDEVEFTAISDKANSFKWTFFPSTSVTFAGGTNENSQNPVVSFSAPGKYTVSLKGWNSLTPTDSATSYAQLIKDQFVIVIDYCNPVIGVTTSADLAINSVLLEDNATPRNSLIDYQSEESDYTDNTEDVREATLTFGGTYNLTLERATTANKINRKVWIDWNIDGDFDDAGEMVLNEGTTQNNVFSGSFVVPDLANSFEGATRMRIGTSYGNDRNEPCGATSNPNANRIGEFEDYSLVLANDNTFPYITMNGSDTVRFEVGSTYADAGATVMDPTEGDITSRLVTTSDVDANAAGIYYVTYCASDASGNAAECVQRVVYVVVDQSAPDLTLNGNNPEYVDVITGTYTEAGWDAMDKTDGDLKTAVQVTGEVNTFKIGSYILTYSVQDAQGNIATATREVIVRDQVFPTITNDEIKVVNGRNVVEVQLQSVFVDRTIPADNYNNGTFGPMFSYHISPANAQGDADVDTRVKGTTVVTYTATDETGNETILVIDYVVEDYIAPVINLNTLDTVTHLVNSPYTPVEASVTDNLYDYTQVSLTRNSNVNPFLLGLYTDEYTATDASGNVTVRNRWVRVVDEESPVIASKAGPVIRLGLYSNVRLSEYLKLTDNYDAPTELLANLETLFNGVNFYEEGMYAAEFQTHDNSGNASDVFTLYVHVSRQFERISSVETVEGTSLMKVYPNPSNGLFNITLDLPTSEDVTVEVYDQTGRKVADVAEGQLQKGSFLVDMSGETAGMYIVRMITNHNVYNQKITIQ